MRLTPSGPGPPGTTLSGTVNTDGNGDFVNASMLRGDFDAGTDLGAAGGYVDIDLVSGVATIYVSALELGFPTDYRVYVASVYGTWTRRTTPPVLDIDYDGIADDIDNCQAVYNPGQADTDKDGIGDLCEPDQDEDGINDDDDNCPTVSNPDQADINVDGFGDVCVSPDVVIPKGSDVGENVIIEEGVLLQKDSAIGDDTTIGENVSVGKGSSIGESTDISADTSLSKETEVGSQVIIGDGVLIAKGVVIGNGVIIGDNVVIRKDTIIGDGVMVGSGVLIEQNVTILDGANIDPDTTVPAGSTFPP